MGVKMIGCELGDGRWNVEERRWELEEKKETIARANEDESWTKVKATRIRVDRNEDGILNHVFICLTFSYQSPKQKDIFSVLNQINTETEGVNTV